MDLAAPHGAFLLMGAIHSSALTCQVILQLLLGRGVTRTSGAPAVANYNIGGLSFQVHTYEAEQIPTLQVEQQQLAAIKAIVFERRDELRDIFAAEDLTNSKVYFSCLRVIANSLVFGLKGLLSPLVLVLDLVHPSPLRCSLGMSSCGHLSTRSRSPLRRRLSKGLPSTRRPP